MKSITEFPSFVLSKGLAAKTALTAEGKSPEEMHQSLGAAFKLEGDKLTHFIAAMEVASNNLQDLRRVLVIGLAEGENVPAKAVKIEEHYYLPEFLLVAKPKSAEGDHKGGRRGGPVGKNKGGPKSSPWGMSPEEKAAKNKGAAKTESKA